MAEKRGPKYKYASWMCDVVCEVAATPGQYQSAMLWEIGKRLGYNRPISADTFARWRRENPEFEEAWQQSKIISQANDELSVMNFATGKTRGSAAAFALLFNAKYKEEYRPAVESGSTTINNNLTIENLSVEELKYRIARSSEVLQKSGQLLEHKPDEDIIDVDFSE